MTDPNITTVLLDLDGVVRHFDAGHVSAVERAHGLDPGVLIAAAFDPDLLGLVTTGRIPRREWVRRIGATVGHASAAQEWLAALGVVDATMLAEVEGLRARGLRVALLTNGTDTIDGELAALCLDGCFDAVFNSATIGFAKPDPRVFRHVCDELQVRPPEVFFVDDSVANVAAAIDVGISATHFVDVDSFRAALVRVGVGIGEQE